MEAAWRHAHSYLMLPLSLCTYACNIGYMRLLRSKQQWKSSGGDERKKWRRKQEQWISILMFFAKSRDLPYGILSVGTRKTLRRSWYAPLVHSNVQAGNSRKKELFCWLSLKSLPGWLLMQNGKLAHFVALENFKKEFLWGLSLLLAFLSL